MQQKLSYAGLQVCTLWQGAVLLVQAFPLFPDMVAVAHTIADDAGEPSAAAIHAAALADQNVMQGKQCDYLRASAWLHLILVCACLLLRSQNVLTAQKQRGIKSDEKRRVWKTAISLLDLAGLSFMAGHLTFVGQLAPLLFAAC